MLRLKRCRPPSSATPSEAADPEGAVLEEAPEPEVVVAEVSAVSGRLQGLP